MPGYKRSEMYEPEPKPSIVEKIETRFVMPRIPFGLTAFQIIQVAMLMYIILRLNKIV